MPIPLQDGLDIKKPAPADLRTEFGPGKFYETKEAIPLSKRFEWLTTTDVASGVKWELAGGTANENWQEVVAGAEVIDIFKKFENIANLKVAGLAVGQKWKCYGYYELGDGYSKKGTVVAESGQNIDNGKYHLLANGLVADVYLPAHNSFNPITWGSNSISNINADTADRMQKMYDYLYNKGGNYTIKNQTIEYVFEKEVNIRTSNTKAFDLEGNKSTIKAKDNSTAFDLLTVNKNLIYDAENGDRLRPTSFGITQHMGYNCSISNLDFKYGKIQLQSFVTYNLELKKINHSSAGYRSHDLVFALNSRIVSCNSHGAGSEDFVIRDGSTPDIIPNVKYSLWHKELESDINGASASNSSKYEGCRVYSKTDSITAFRDYNNSNVNYENIIAEGHSNLFKFYSEGLNTTSYGGKVSNFHIESTAIYTFFIKGKKNFSLDEIYEQLGGYWHLEGNVSISNLSYMVGKFHITQYSPTYENEKAINNILTPPVSPSEGDRYLISNCNNTPVSATNEWAGHEEQLATYSGGQWIFRSYNDEWYWIVRLANNNPIYDKDRYEEVSVFNHDTGLFGNRISGRGVSLVVDNSVDVSLNRFQDSFRRGSITKYSQNKISSTSKLIVDVLNDDESFGSFKTNEIQSNQIDVIDSVVSGEASFFFGGSSWKANYPLLYTSGYGNLKGRAAQAGPIIPADVSPTPTQSEVQAVLNFAREVSDNLHMLGLFVDKSNIVTFEQVGVSENWTTDGVGRFIQLSTNGLGNDSYFTVTVAGGIVTDIVLYIGGTNYVPNEEITLTYFGYGDPEPIGGDTITIKVLTTD